MDIKLGTDILYIPRLKKIIKNNESFINKVYTEKERKLAQELTNPLYFYATRFAAKEAIMKATDCKYDFREIEILKEKSGKPTARITTNPDIKIELSLSYDNDYAICFCTTKK